MLFVRYSFNMKNIFFAFLLTAALIQTTVPARVTQAISNERKLTKPFSPNTGKGRSKVDLSAEDFLSGHEIIKINDPNRKVKQHKYKKIVTSTKNDVAKEIETSEKGKFIKIKNKHTGIQKTAAILKSGEKIKQIRDQVNCITITLFTDRLGRTSKIRQDESNGNSIITFIDDEIEDGSTNRNDKVNRDLPSYSALRKSILQENSSGSSSNSTPNGKQHNKISVRSKSMPSNNPSISSDGNTGFSRGRTIIGNDISFTGDVNEILGNRNSIVGNVISITGNGNVVTGNINSINGNGNIVERGKPNMLHDRTILIKGTDNFITANNYGPYSTNRIVNGKTIKVTNAGIIIDGNKVTYFGFQGYPSSGTATDRQKYLSAIFEDISTREGRVNDHRNIGYLVHFSPNGSKWRTDDLAIIQEVLKDGHTASIIDDGGYTEYNSLDGKLSWSRNEGIIENGKFILQRDYLKDLGDYIQFRMSKNNVILWPKYTDRNRDTYEYEPKNGVFKDYEEVEKLVTTPITAEEEKDSKCIMKPDERQTVDETVIINGKKIKPILKTGRVPNEGKIKGKKRVTFNDNSDILYFDKHEIQ